jgi:putative ABC transport system substrate-binding protein
MKAMRTATAIVLALCFLVTSSAGEAEEPAKIYKLGFLMGMDPQPKWTEAFEQGLRALGWSQGRNITIEYRSAEGYFERLPELCAGLVSHSVGLILAVSAPETAAAKQCTSTIPIVFAIHGDPVGTGDVESLAHPGGNATGMSQTQGDLVSKLLGAAQRSRASPVAPRSAMERYGQVKTT